MSRLTHELKAEHQVLIARIDEVKKTIGTPEAPQMLTLVKVGLLAHLLKEDKKLYPPLRAAAREDRHLAEMLESFARDMEQISTAAMAFFDKYEGKSTEDNALEFGRDFGMLCARMARRIHSEETILYPAFDQIDSKWLAAGPEEPASPDAPVPARPAGDAKLADSLAQIRVRAAEAREQLAHQSRAPSAFSESRFIDRMGPSAPSQDPAPAAAAQAIRKSGRGPSVSIVYGALAVAAVAVVATLAFML